MIVKIQRPLESNIPDPPVLIYDEEKHFKILVPFTEKLREALGDKDKAYWEVEMHKEGFRLIREVPGQTW